MSFPVQGFPYVLRPALAERAAIGLLALATDATIESEWRLLLNLDGVELYVGRVANDPEIRPSTLAKMEVRLGDAAAALLPGCRLDVMAYGCTSATLIIGEETVERAIRAARPEVAVTHPLGAAKAALAALGVGRLALLTPYVDELTQGLVEHLRAAGFDVAAAGSFHNPLDPEVVRIAPESIMEAATALVAGGDVEALFIACTALRAAALVEPLEDSLGIPVITSNQAMAWHALRLAGVADAPPSAGRLFQR
ncbi:MAG: Asp/Glu racemase [bacterium]|nr:Asp/Glu racemase [bacterium]